MRARELVERVYAALAAGDRETLTGLLAPDVETWLTASLPAPIGGHHVGVEDCIANGWWAIGARYRVRAEPEQFLPCDDGSLLVLGTYRGNERATDRTVEAAFAHLWSVSDGRVQTLRQYTDSAAWLGAA